MGDKKLGPPYKSIGKVEFEKLCALQCTQQEISDFFGVDHRTITAWCKRTYGQDYRQVYAEKRAGGKIALRRLQFRLAEKSAAMAIFLGKNILNQSDDPVVIQPIDENAKRDADNFNRAIAAKCEDSWKIADVPQNVGDSDESIGGSDNGE